MSPKILSLCAVLSVSVVLFTGCPGMLLSYRLLFDQGACGGAAYLSEAVRSTFFDVEAQIADDFTLPEGDTSVARVTWWGVYANNEVVADDFTLTVYREEGCGFPESGGYLDHRAGDIVNRTLTSGHLVSSMGNLSIYRYRCDVPDWDFDPDTPYFISIVNETASGTWMWCGNNLPTQGNGVFFNRSTWGDAWTNQVGDVAFQLHSDQ